MVMKVQAWRTIYVLLCRELDFLMKEISLANDRCAPTEEWHEIYTKIVDTKKAIKALHLIPADET